MILAAGLGTRLRPLTNLLPKPLAPIGDRPAIGHLVGMLREAGSSRIVVNAHHLAPTMERFAESEAAVTLSIEGELLGTAGGVRRALDAGLVHDERLLVVNGDLFARLPLGETMRASCDGVARLLVSPARGRGNVGVDGRGRVVRLREESVADGERSAFDYLGCALLGDRALAALPRAGCLVGDVLLPLLRAGAHVEVQRFDGPWLDVGSLEAYLAANMTWLVDQNIGRFVGRGAQLHDATVERSVVGVEAVLDSGAHIDRCVVWPGARVPAGSHSARIFAPGVPPIDVGGAAHSAVSQRPPSVSPKTPG